MLYNIIFLAFLRKTKKTKKPWILFLCERFFWDFHFCILQKGNIIFTSFLKDESAPTGVVFEEVSFGRSLVKANLGRHPEHQTPGWCVLGNFAFWEFCKTKPQESTLFLFYNIIKHPWPP